MEEKPGFFFGDEKMGKVSLSRLSLYVFALYIALGYTPPNLNSLGCMLRGTDPVTVTLFRPFSPLNSQEGVFKRLLL